MAGAVYGGVKFETGLSSDADDLPSEDATWCQDKLKKHGSKQE